MMCRVWGKYEIVLRRCGDLDRREKRFANKMVMEPEFSLRLEMRVDDHPKMK